MREPVRSELALVLGHGQVMLNAQVGEDFELAHELRRLEREALALVKRSLDFAADRHQCRQRNLGGVLKWSRESRQLGTFSLKLRAGFGEGYARTGIRDCWCVRV